MATQQLEMGRLKKFCQSWVGPYQIIDTPSSILQNSQSSSQWQDYGSSV